MTLESEILAHQTMYLMRRAAIRAAIESLRLPAGSRGLDAGCGIGLITQLLAETVSPGGHVTGLDLSEEYLEYASSRARSHGCLEKVTFRKGDVNALPFDDCAFDWAWSMDTLWPGPKEIGCPSDDPYAMVRELARVVKPGGQVAILFWSSQKLLPGYPLLEARLNATSQAAAPFSEAMRPDQHVLRGCAWLRAIGLVDVTAGTFVADVLAPLDDKMRHALTVTMHMFWGEVEHEVSAEDWEAYMRLWHPESLDCILDRNDYYAWLTYTMFQGRIPR